MTEVNRHDVPAALRAIAAQGNWERARLRASAAETEVIKQRERFRQHVMEAIEDVPELVNDGWVNYHLVNTFGFSQRDILQMGALQNGKAT